MSKKAKNNPEIECETDEIDEVLPQNSAFSTKKRERLYRKYVKELSPVKQALTGNVLLAASPLITDIARLKVIQDEAFELYTQYGLISVYENGGGQGGERESPAIGTYQKCSRSIGADVSKLLKLVGSNTEAADILVGFVTDD